MTLCSEWRCLADRLFFLLFLSYIQKRNEVGSRVQRPKCCTYNSQRVVNNPKPIRAVKAILVNNWECLTVCHLLKLMIISWIKIKGHFINEISLDTNISKGKIIIDLGNFFSMYTYARACTEKENVILRRRTSSREICRFFDEILQWRIAFKSFQS